MSSWNNDDRSCYETALEIIDRAAQFIEAHDKGGQTFGGSKVQPMEEVFARVSRDEIFKHAGIQFLTFNTLFQLYAHARAGIPSNATSLLLIPDLINLFLTGKRA